MTVEEEAPNGCGAGFPGGLVSLRSKNQPLPPDPVAAGRSVVARKLRTLFPNPVQRVLFVAAPQVGLHQFDNDLARRSRYFCYPPYGLGKLATYVMERGYDVEIVDLNYETLAEAKLRADEFDIVSYWRARLEQAILTYQPDIIGVSCMFTMGYANAMTLVDLVKGYAPNIPVILGGVHMTNARDTTLKDNVKIDLICTYEAEHAFPDMLDFVNGRADESSLTQLATMIDGEVSYITARATPTAEDMDRLPSYLGLPIEKYGQAGEIGNYRFWYSRPTVVSNVLSNRGCRAHCSFCSVSNFNGKKVRSRSIASVLEEIEFLTKRYGVNHISWLDDDLLFNAERAVELFESIIERQLNITWDASNGLIASACTAELMDAAARSGMIGMHVGVESGNPAILKMIRKPSGVKHFLKLGALMDQYPQVFTRGYLIIGFPNETLEMVLDTVRLAHDMKLDWYSIATLTPLPNTDIFDLMVDMEIIQKDKMDWKNNYYSPSHGKMQLREDSERVKARNFENFFEQNLQLVPEKEVMDDLWFLVDYKINYERILTQEDPRRLRKIRALLTDVADRSTRKNPLVNLFLGIVEAKQGNFAEASRRRALSEEFLRGSVYWQKRFEVLDLHSLMREIERPRTIVGPDSLRS